MKPEHLKQLIDAKRRSTEPLTSQDKTNGFKGWYSSNSLPHFDSPGAQQYVTFRLADSLPSRRRGEWEIILAIGSDLEKRRKLERYLDLGYGAAYLRNPLVARLVQASLWHHDGIKYRLLAWVIMPNHLHVLIEVWHVPMGEIIRSWKGYTSKQANKILARHGAFWEDDYFDRFIRNEDHLRRVVHYIETNPVKAGLVPCAVDWPWSSARFRSKQDISVRALTHPGVERFPDKK